MMLAILQHHNTAQAILNFCCSSAALPAPSGTARVVQHRHRHANLKQEVVTLLGVGDALLEGNCLTHIFLLSLLMP